MSNSHAPCSNIIASFSNTAYVSDLDAQIMRWLSPLEPTAKHQAVRNYRYDGVGGWLLKTNEFQEWRGSEEGADKAVLFCHGNLGVGKTYLSSLVIDSLLDQEKQKNIAVAGLYCDYQDQSEQTTTNIMGAILKQLVGGGQIPKYLREAFQKGRSKFGGRGLRLPELMAMLRITIASLPQVFICIDALDECLPKLLPDLLGSLRDIVQESPTTRILLTGRPHIREDIQGYFTKAVVISISPNMDDIRSYVNMRLDRDTAPESMTNYLREDIMRVILKEMSEIFLLVSLSIDAILNEVTIGRRRRKLAEMAQGNGLRHAYTATLTRLKAQKGNKSILGLKVLMWVLHSERPLRAEELCDALGVEMGAADLHLENVPTLRTLLASSLGLVTVEASSSTVRLVHFTLHEYIFNDPTLFHSPHSMIAEACLTYLNFRCVRELSPTLYSAPSTMPLLEYASCYWGEHARREMTENVKILALRLLYIFDEHVSAQLMFKYYNRGLGSNFDVAGEPLGFTGLHGAAFLGSEELVTAVLDVKAWDVNATDNAGSTALICAAGRGHDGVVGTLMAQEDVTPDQPDAQHGRTPLSWAAGNGHEGVVKMLLDREDVNPGQADLQYGWTPLWWAAEHGHEGIVKMLFQREDADPNPPDLRSSQVPLWWAAASGNEGAVKLILERGDVNPDQPSTRYDRTPLSWAAGNGHEGVVKFFLEQEDVSPDRPDTQFGRTPLSWAAGRGCEEIVKMLLQRDDINPDPADFYGRTPLLWAASRRHERVVKLFLKRRYPVPNQAAIDQAQTASPAERSGLPRFPSLWIPNSWLSPWKHVTPAYHTRLALRIAIDICFLIAVLFFLSYFPSSIAG